MTAELYHTLLAWLESGDDAQVRHAAYRLSLPDAVGYVPGEEAPARSSFVPAFAVAPDPWTVKINGCPHYNPGCCASPAPFCDLFNINPTREQCIECLSR